MAADSDSLPITYAQLLHLQDFYEAIKHAEALVSFQYKYCQFMTPFLESEEGSTKRGNAPSNVADDSREGGDGVIRILICSEVLRIFLLFHCPHNFFSCSRCIPHDDSQLDCTFVVDLH